MLSKWDKSRLLHREAAALLSRLDDTPNAYRDVQHALSDAYEKGFIKGRGNTTNAAAASASEDASDRRAGGSGGLGEVDGVPDHQ